MRASLHCASDWIYIPLADSQRSLVSVMFAKRSGPPLRLRTSDPLVNRSPMKSFVFKKDILLQRLRTGLHGSRYQVCRGRSAGCGSWHDSAHATETCVVMRGRCRPGCAWAWKGACRMRVCCMRAAAASHRVLVLHPCRQLRVGRAWACALRLHIGREQAVLPLTRACRQ